MRNSLIVKVTGSRRKATGWIASNNPMPCLAIYPGGKEDEEVTVDLEQLITLLKDKKLI